MRDKRSLTIWCLLLAVLALLGAGCGGDDGGGSSSSSGNSDEESSEPLDEDEFVDQVSEICTESEEEVLEIQEEADIDPGEFEESAEAAGEIIESLEASLEELREITPPEDLEEDYDELLSTVEEDFIGGVEDLQAAAEDEDEDAFEEAQEDLSDVEEDIGELEEDLGIECGEDLSDDFSDASDFSDDFSSDFSDDLSDDASLGAPVSPSIHITEYGSEPEFDALADSCFAGVLEDCDTLFRETPVSSSIFSYEGYGATCGGRLVEERPGQCAALG